MGRQYQINFPVDDFELGEKIKRYVLRMLG